MKRWIPAVALLLVLCSGGCARLKNRPVRIVLPPDARAARPPAESVQIVEQPAAEPAPKKSWWRRRSEDESPPSAVQTSAVQSAVTEAAPKRRWWPFRSKEVVKPLPAEQATSVYRIKEGDPLIIYLRGVPGYAGGQQNIEGVVDENGTINLPFLNFVEVAGKSPSELEREITSMYVDGGYYRNIGVNIIVPTRSYYVRGEVRGAGRFQLTGNVTVLQALAAAGGFTDFANVRRVEILRGDKRIRVNVRELEKNPAKDQPLEAGDVIIVPRSAF